MSHLPDSAAVLAVKASGIEQRYASRLALAGVDVEVAAGEMVAIVGPNGSGKSTLARLVSMIEQPKAGTLDLFGVTVQTASMSLRSRIAVVFQSPALDPILSVRENLRVHAGLLGMEPGMVGKRIEHIASEFALVDRLDERVGVLSGGFARRVDLARAMLASPDLLVLDEATAGLDDSSRHAVIGLLRERAAGGAGVLLATHHFDEAELADRVIMLSEGRVVGEGSAQALTSSLGELVLTGDSRQMPADTDESIVCRSTHQGWIVTGETGRVRHLAGELATLGVSVRLGPPTLRDVYRWRVNDG
ncbi:MAG: ABC transporter ATP-binding protein [Planctomycetota bacterium]